MQSQSVENVFARAWDLLTKNWVLLVPGLIVGLVLGVFSALITPPAANTISVDTNGNYTNLGSLGGRFLAGALIAVAGIAAYIITQCYTAGMAGAAWMRGTTTLADGAASLREDAGRVFIAAIALFAVGAIAAVFSVFTLGLSLLAFYVFFIYTIPAAVVGNRPGIDSLRESCAIARARFGPTVIAALLLFVISIAAGLLTLPLVFVPFLGPIVRAILGQVVTAYVTLVIVGQYLNLRGTSARDPIV